MVVIQEVNADGSQGEPEELRPAGESDEDSESDDGGFLGSSDDDLLEFGSGDSDEFDSDEEEDVEGASEIEEVLEEEESEEQKEDGTLCFSIFCVQWLQFAANLWFHLVQSKFT